MYIFDTDTLTHLHKGNANVKKRLSQSPGFEFAITIVTRCEIIRGRIDFLLKASDGQHLQRAQKYLLETENLLAQIPTIDFQGYALDRFDELRVHPRFRKVGRSDLLIASICLAENATLVTRNTRHFAQFPNLSVENWVD